MKGFDDDLERGGYRASADVHMFIPLIIVTILLVLVVTAFVVVAKKDIATHDVAGEQNTVIVATETELQ